MGYNYRTVSCTGTVEFGDYHVTRNNQWECPTKLSYITRGLKPYSRKQQFISPPKNMTMTIHIGIIFLASFVSCVHLRQFCSSYFTFSHLKQSRADSDTIAEFKADTELTCALRCNTREDCTEAIFNRDSKKCFLYQKKEKGSIDSHASEDNTRSRIVTMKKVSNILKTWFRFRDKFS